MHNPPTLNYPVALVSSFLKKIAVSGWIFLHFTCCVVDIMTVGRYTIMCFGDDDDACMPVEELMIT